MGILKAYETSTMSFNATIKDTKGSDEVLYCYGVESMSSACN